MDQRKSTRDGNQPTVSEKGLGSRAYVRNAMGNHPGYMVDSDMRMGGTVARCGLKEAESVNNISGE
eukprot:1253750-Alexandrium_andersonii.AAC.1